MEDIQDAKSVDYDDFEKEAPAINQFDNDDPMGNTILSHINVLGKYLFYL